VVNLTCMAIRILREAFDRRTPEIVAASVISSVIALAKPENGRERTKADDRIGKRQITGTV